MPDRLKIHVVLNSHIDPVWLWRRGQGIDEVLATARTACNILRDYPEAIMTRGEAWFYETVEKCDPELFRRIRSYYDEGRWDIVGGWHVQADCNLPSRDIFMKHAEIGRRYFRDKFGCEVKTAYNVDSFGHAAFLPSILRECGFDNYVFMRPGRKEKELPAAVFKWQAPDGRSVNAFRIEESYSTSLYDYPSFYEMLLEKTLKAADVSLGHVMLFVGTGDHGGGPARREIEWIMEKREARGDIELAFSSPDIFFAEIAAENKELPVVRDELQHHAIGCYSAVGRIKREVRDSARLLEYAEPYARDAQRYEEEWKKVLFATFHDILAGTSIESAYSDIYEDLGSARSFARNLIEAEIRRKNASLKPCSRQRLIFDNLSGADFCGWHQFTPWIIFPAFAENCFFRMLDEKGHGIPLQRITGESPACRNFHFAARIAVPAHGRRIYRLEILNRKPECRIQKSDLCLECGPHGISSLKLGRKKYLASPSMVCVFTDKSDTWSHGMNSYPVVSPKVFKGGTEWEDDYDGDFIYSRFNVMKVQGGSLCYEIRTYAEEEYVDCHLRLNWHDSHKLVKMVFKPSFKVRKRIDGVSGGFIERKLNGEEYPMEGCVVLSGEGGESLAFVSDDITSLDVQQDGTVRLTLLRSPQYADHFPWEKSPKFAITEQGYTDITLRIIPQRKYDARIIGQSIAELKNPIFFSETTNGVRRVVIDNRVVDIED